MGPPCQHKREAVITSLSHCLFIAAELGTMGIELDTKIADKANLACSLSVVGKA